MPPSFRTLLNLIESHDVAHISDSVIGVRETNHASDVTLDQITVDLLWDALEQRPDADFHNGWLIRAYEACDGKLTTAARNSLALELDQARSALSGLFASGRAILYRGTTKMPEAPLGVHWSNTPLKAYRHGVFLTRIEATSEDVDWIASVIRRISWPNEEEVSLLRGRSVNVLSIEHQGETVAENSSATV